MRSLGARVKEEMVKWLIKGSTGAVFKPRHFSDLREKTGGELNSAVVKALIKGLMAVSSSTRVDWKRSARQSSV
eukprot:7416234-Pyramimonas_sp.AAC.1